MYDLEREPFQTLQVTRDGAILTVTLNRPGQRNAVNQAMHAELARLFPLIELDESSRIVVLTGAGDAFCAGGDLDYMRYMRDTPGAFAHSAMEARRIVHGVLDLTKPMIARINGDAVGLGATLALLADISVAHDTARIGDPHVRVGLVAGDGGAVIWPALLGFARARAALLTGELIRADEAERIGLINQAVASVELESAVASWADRLDKGSTMAVRYTKMALNATLRQTAAGILDGSLGHEIVTALSDDHAEAVRAFEEGRKPVFRKA